MEPGTRYPGDVALAAVAQALAPAGPPHDVWRKFVARLRLACSDDGFVHESVVHESVRALRPGVAVAEFLTALGRLGVLDGRGSRVAYFPRAAEEVARALELGGAPLLSAHPPPSWVPVGTVPELLRHQILVPGLRQTAGVLLEIIDHARARLWLSAPFLEPLAIDFLQGAVLGALARGVRVSFIVRPGAGATGGPLAAMIEHTEQRALVGLEVFEIETAASDLGSHAKVCLADDEICYLGSANLTTHGLGRHIELGARLSGPNVAAIAAVLEAVAGLGARTYPRPR